MKQRILFFFFAIIFSHYADGVPVDEGTFDRYHQYHEIRKIIDSWHSTYPDLVTSVIFGKSAGNYDLLVVEIAAKPTGTINPSSRPGIFVSANIDGRHLLGSETALLLGEKLLNDYGLEDSITKMLQTSTIYIAPLFNPDAAQTYFVKPAYERVTNNQPLDDDLDGKIDEDGPDDSTMMDLSPKCV